MNIELIDLGKPPHGEGGDNFYDAVKKCNNNFKQISNQLKLIEENEADKMFSQPRFSISTINLFDVLESNSKVLGYKFVSLRDCVNTEGHIMPKRMFEKINEYFKTLTAK